MPFLTPDQLYAAARDLRQQSNKTSDQLLREYYDTSRDKFDVFLSHSSRDKDLVVGARKLIEDRGYTVYVDWIDDANLNKAADRSLASRLRLRMRQCESLFYLHTPNSTLSKWCPWELGFFDGLRSPEARVFILPVVRAGEGYRGQEYLDLYETVDLSTWRPPQSGKRAGGIDPITARLLTDQFRMLRRPGGGIF